MRYSQKSIVGSIANQRMCILYNNALEIMMKNPNLSKSYIKELRKISIHYKQKLPKYMKDKICMSCGSVLVRGFNCRVRLSSEGYISLLCDCGREKHIFYKKC